MCKCIFCNADTREESHQVTIYDTPLRMAICDKCVVRIHVAAQRKKGDTVKDIIEKVCNDICNYLETDDSNHHDRVDIVYIGDIGGDITLRFLNMMMKAGIIIEDKTSIMKSHFYLNKQKDYGKEIHKVSQ
jgi:hypothetical protein